MIGKCQGAVTLEEIPVCNPLICLAPPWAIAGSWAVWRTWCMEASAMNASATSVTIHLSSPCRFHGRVADLAHGGRWVLMEYDELFVDDSPGAARLREWCVHHAAH